MDRQRLEYLVTSLYSSETPQYAAALSQILDAADFKKPLAGLTRELVDVGMRCAYHEDRLDEAMQFADCTRSLVSLFIDDAKQFRLTCFSGRRPPPARFASSLMYTSRLNAHMVRLTVCGLG